MLYLVYLSMKAELKRFEASFVFSLTILVIEIVSLHMAPESGWCERVCQSLDQTEEDW